uniref:Kunitz protease inhibitor n=1 Tax=Biomphalaria glabrata TaxID=6526 RepID=Q86DH8_BIOGL|nr:Kunitz protease inhibitor [Biomphalaria glabrata]
MNFFCLLVCIMITMVQFSMQKQQASLCKLDSDRGTCKGFGIRYHYKQSDGQCHMFTYSGCGGNKNNFRTQQACMTTCSSQKG